MSKPKPLISINKGYYPIFTCLSVEHLTEGSLQIVGCGNSYKEAYQDWLSEYNRWLESFQQDNTQ